MMQIDDSVLQAKLDAMNAKLDLLVGRIPTPVPIPTRVWKTLWSDDFSTYPLGDLPTVWRKDFPWVGANQDGCSTQIVAFQDFEALKCTVKDAYHKSQGARGFFHPDSPRWDILVPYVGKLVRLTHRQMFLKAFQLEAGNQLWTSAGVEIKDHDGPAVVAADLLEDSTFALQHYTTLTSSPAKVPVKWGEWFNAELLVQVSKSADGYAELRLSDGTLIHSQGNTVNPNDGGAAIALCLYGNNIIGGEATCYFTDFRIEVAV